MEHLLDFSQLRITASYTIIMHQLVEQRLKLINEKPIISFRKSLGFFSEGLSHPFMLILQTTLALAIPWQHCIQFLQTFMQLLKKQALTEMCLNLGIYEN